jgi:N-methylhydantoinase A/oxoprolinase/acetone carboxylase beta subunit
LQPVVASISGKLDAALAAQVRPAAHHSISGGIMSTTTARKLQARRRCRDPAAGVVASAARQNAALTIITCDLGGTSFDDFGHRCRHGLSHCIPAL